MKKTICIDFDGVIAQYNGEFEQDKFGEPVAGVKNALKVLKENGYTIIIFTTRKPTAKFKKYLADNEITYDAINENPDQPDKTNPGKPIADIYLSAHAIRFDGNWKWTLESIASFRPYCEKKEDEKKDMESIFKRYKEYAKKKSNIVSIG
jgi:adenylylsulfate kinase